MKISIVPLWLYFRSTECKKFNDIVHGMIGKLTSSVERTRRKSQLKKALSQCISHILATLFNIIRESIAPGKKHPSIVMEVRLFDASSSWETIKALFSFHRVFWFFLNLLDSQLAILAWSEREYSDPVGWMYLLPMYIYNRVWCSLLRKESLSICWYIDNSHFHFLNAYLIVIAPFSSTFYTWAIILRFFKSRPCSHDGAVLELCHPRFMKLINDWTHFKFKQYYFNPVKTRPLFWLGSRCIPNQVRIPMRLILCFLR